MNASEWIDLVESKSVSPVGNLCRRLAEISAVRKDLLFAAKVPYRERTPACWYTTISNEYLGYYIGVTPLRLGWWRDKTAGPVIRIRTGQSKANKQLSKDFPAQVRNLIMHSNGLFADEVLRSEAARWKGDGFKVQGEGELLIFVNDFVCRFDLVTELIPIIKKLDGCMYALPRI